MHPFVRMYPENDKILVALLNKASMCFPCIAYISSPVSLPCPSHPDQTYATGSSGVSGLPVSLGEQQSGVSGSPL